MSIDTGPIGKVAAELMEALPEETEGKVVAVGLVVVVDDGEETYTRTKTWPAPRYVQVGLFSEALEVVRYGVDTDE